MSFFSLAQLAHNYFSMFVELFMAKYFMLIRLIGGIYGIWKLRVKPEMYTFHKYQL